VRSQSLTAPAAAKDLQVNVTRIHQRTFAMVHHVHHVVQLRALSKRKLFV
jgi:hypothetical protein